MPISFRQTIQGGSPMSANTAEKNFDIAHGYSVQGNILEKAFKNVTEASVKYYSIAGSDILGTGEAFLFDDGFDVVDLMRANISVATLLYEIDSVKAEYSGTLRYSLRGTPTYASALELVIFKLGEHAKSDNYAITAYYTYKAADVIDSASTYDGTGVFDIHYRLFVEMSTNSGIAIIGVSKVE